MKVLLGFLTRPPVIAVQDDATRDIRLLHLVVLSVFGFVILHTAGLFLVYKRKLAVSIFLLALLAIAAVCLWLTRRGRLHLAKVVLTFGLWCLAALCVALDGGVTGPSIYYFLVVCVFAALLLGLRGVAVCASFTILTGMGMLLAESMGHPIPRYFFVLPLPGFITFTFALLFVMVPLNLLLSELKNALALTHSQLREREQAAALLQESEDRYRDLVEHSEDLICTHDLQGNLLTVNDPPAKILGYTKEELIHRPLRDFVIAEARPMCDAYLSQIQRDGSAKGLLSVLTKNGEVRLWEYNNTLRKEGVNSPIVRGTAHDVTEQKRAERALRLSEEKFSRAFKASPIDMAITTIGEGRFIDVNESFERLTGFARDEVIGRTSMELGLWVNPAERDAVIEDLRGGRQVRSREVQFRAKSGHIRVKLYSAEIIGVGDDQCLLAVCEDITLRKTVEQALCLSEEKFSKAFRCSPSIIAITTLEEGNFMEINEAFEKQSGYARSEILGRTALEIGLWLNPLERQDLVEEIRKSGHVRNKEVRLRAKSGSVVVFMLSAESIDLAGQRCVLTVGQDITQQKESEVALRQSEADYRSLFLQAPYGSYRVAFDGTFLIVNQALLDILGYASPEELCSENREEDIFRDPEDRRRMIEHTQGCDDHKDIELYWKRKDSGVILVRVKSRICRNGKGEIEYYERSVEDVTQKRAIERHLQQAQRMEAIGFLAGGIAHDFNNLLTGILGYAELVLKSLGPTDPSKTRLKTIVAAAMQGRDLTGKLLAFSHGDSLPLYPINLDEEIQQMESFIRAMIDENINIEIHLRHGSERVLLGTSLLYQILINLAVNSKDAMPRGGRLGIKSTLAVIGSDKAHPAGVPQGRYVCLEVNDTGSGMDRALLDRIFDPFFTTKKPGKGSGLGLYSVFGIVRQCSGYVRVSSEIGKGSTFEIYFPVVDLPVPKECEISESTSKGEAKETILLVEDNASVRNAVRDQLADLGYLVLCESNSVQALQDAQGLYADIDLLLSDVVMPDLNGPDLARRLKEKQSKLKVLFMTGYAREDVLPLDALDTGTDLLRKPFTHEELNTKIRRLLCFRP